MSRVVEEPVGEPAEGRVSQPTVRAPRTSMLSDLTVPGQPAAGGGDDSFLLATKLAIPPARSDVVSRLRLIDRLCAGRSRRLSLLAAPAGFGKTTLLAEWIHRDAVPTAWVTLDSGDDDLIRFWSYVLGALERVQPGVGRVAQALLHSPQPPIEVVLTALINSLSELSQDLVLVFDDYHQVSATAVHRSVTFLLDHAPPRLHLVIATRADPPLPLARLRARGQLTELRAADLRFTEAEAAEFLTGVVGLELSAADVSALEERTEGWIVGLQLAALSMQGRQDVASFVRAFTGSHRFVVDYLAQEVLARQPEPVQTFLLETAILDSLDASLADAVTGRNDSQTMLEHLEEANLFLVPLDDERCWYRYHQLFAELLRHRLRRAHPDRVPKLHRRASTWFESRGFIREAIDHAVAAGDFERARRLVALSAPDLLRRGRVTTLRGWLEALPPEIVRASPRLGLIQAWLLYFSGQLGAAEQLLDDVERRVGELAGTAAGADEASEHLGSIATIRAFVALSRGDVARASGSARQALDLLPSDAALRGIVTMNLGRVYWLTGDVDAAVRAIDESLVLSRATGHLYGIFVATSERAHLWVVRGKLHEAEAMYRQALELAAELGEALPVAGLVYLGLGDLYREWNDLEAATSFLDQGIEQCQELGNVELTCRGLVALAFLRHAAGDTAGARSALEQARSVVRQHDYAPLIVAALDAYNACLALQQGQSEVAFRWAEATGLRADDELSYPRELEYAVLVRVFLAQGRMDEALRLTERLLERARRQERFSHVIVLLVLRAIGWQARGDEAQALASLEEALVLAEPEGYVRAFVDEGAPARTLLRVWCARRSPGDPRLAGYVRRLLGAFPPDAERGGAVSDDDPVPPASRSPGRDAEPLSEREVEILRLIAAGCSNREIADRLVLALSTVKWYVNTIYGKLQVDSRTRAIARARQLKLLAD